MGGGITVTTVAEAAFKDIRRANIFDDSDTATGKRRSARDAR